MAIPIKDQIAELGIGPWQFSRFMCERYGFDFNKFVYRLQIDKFTIKMMMALWCQGLDPGFPEFMTKGMTGPEVIVDNSDDEIYIILKMHRESGGFRVMTDEIKKARGNG